MTSCQIASFLLPSADATSALARQIAPHLQAGDTILLSGELGSGKTHFARALIRSRLAAQDQPAEIPSPTYTLVQTYHDGSVDIWHADLYRLTGPPEVLELGLPDAMQDCICLIEWPDRLGEYRPANALTVELQYAEPGARKAILSSDGRCWVELSKLDV